MPFYPPPLIPPARGGKKELIPLDGGGPGAGEKRELPIWLKK